MADGTARVIGVLPNTANVQSAPALARSYSDARAGAPDVQRSPASRSSHAGTRSIAKVIHAGTPTSTRIMTAEEASAHLQLVSLMARRRSIARYRGLTRGERAARREWLSRQMDPHLAVFLRSPRCNCGLVLVSTPRYGRTEFRCMCGWKGVTA